jgi:uncharacterized Zn finger protein (UPF0148 family)
MTEKKNDTPSAICTHCGGIIELDEGKEYVSCPYCGTNFAVADLLEESDAVRIARIKSEAEKEIAETQEKIESEKIKYENERSIRKSAVDFKKSAFSKILIVLIVFSFILSTVLSTGYVRSGIIALVMAGMFIIRYLMGVQVIKVKNQNLRTIPAIIGFVLLVPYFAMFGVDSEPQPIAKSDDIAWSDIVMGDQLPEPEVKAGYIYTNDSTGLWLKMTDVSSSQYNSYIKSCRSDGYTIDSTTTSYSFNAYNKDGYKLELGYDNVENEMRISLEPPMEFTEVKWPTSGIGAEVPEPESTKRHLASEHNTYFNIYIGDTTKAQYSAYVDECYNNGFSVEYSKGDDYFYAQNADGYRLSLRYEGFNTMSINLYKSDN